MDGIMLRIKFRFKDKYTKGNWSYCECVVSSLSECKRIYGLDTDPDCYEYEILSTESV